MAKYFKLEAANSQDLEQIMWLLKNKTFFPESTSTPALPGSYDIAFDYRQLFKFISLHNGYPVVKTREDISTVQFGTKMVPTAEWTSRYQLSAAPTITAMPDEFEYINGKPGNTTADVFLTYHY